jgi:hypothetical protein
MYLYFAEEDHDNHMRVNTVCHWLLNHCEYDWHTAV